MPVSNSDVLQNIINKFLCCSVQKPVNGQKNNIRNWIGFWILGLSNHYAFCIMLAAAHDILSETGQQEHHLFCNPLGTGALLVADTIPALIAIVISPFMFSNTTIRILITMALSLASFNLAGISTSYTTAFVGVISGSFACGFGESSVLAYATRFDKQVVSGWSSGTGTSHVASASIYLLLSMFMQSKQIILIMNIVPFLMGIAYFAIVVPPEPQQLEQVACTHEKEVDSAFGNEDSSKSLMQRVTARLRIIRHGLWYAVPIFITTFSMYFIGQGLFELLFFGGTGIDQDMQYRLYTTLSAIGVVIARSSVQMISTEKLWLFPIMQTTVLALILTHILKPFLPNIYVVLVLIFMAGIFGGATYANTFYKINNRCDATYKPTITAMSLIGNELAATMAGFVAIPAHDALCAVITGHGV